MAANVTVSADEMDIDEIRCEVEASQWTDDPDSLRSTIARIAQIAIGLSEDSVDGPCWGAVEYWLDKHSGDDTISGYQLAELAGYEPQG